MKRKIFFIVGFPRSGTKLLRTILNNHDQIFVTEELMFLPHLLANWNRYGDLSSLDNFRRMHAEIMQTFYFQVRAQQGIALLSAEDWHGACQKYDPAGVLMAMILHETRAPTSDVWLGDKSPNYTTHIQTIKADIPEAVIIHIVRDVRDAALSARNIWNKNIFRFSQRWADGMRLLWSDAQGLSDSEFLEIRYEDLLRNPKGTLIRITSLLGLPFDEQMISLQEPSENFGDAKSAHCILPGNTQKYLLHLSDWERQKVEAIAGDVLAHYGYETRRERKISRLSDFAMARYMIMDVLNRIRFELQLGRGFFFTMKSLFSRARTRL